MDLFSSLFGSGRGEPPRIAASRQERARVLLLSKHVKGYHVDRFPDYWEEPLGEPAATAIQRFVADGLLAPASLSVNCDLRFKVPELKALLHERGLPVSGKKSLQIERLLSADQAGMEALVGATSAYICTPRGVAMVEQYLAAEAARNQALDALVLQKLQDGNLRAAITALHDQSLPPIFSNPIAIQFGVEDDIARAQATMSARPKILLGMSEGEWKVAQIAATMQMLYGARDATPWLPEGFKGATNLDPNTAVRMIVFAGKSRMELAQAKSLGCRKVKVSDCGSASCPACRSLARVFLIGEAPELPYEHCTHRMGCRCMYLPELEF